MPHLQKTLLATLLASFSLASAADNSIASAVAASLTTQVVSTGTAVYMKNNGMNPQFVTTPYGTYVVPQSTAPATSPTTQPKPSAYEVQNQQQNKIEFLNGNVVQSFPNLPPEETTGT